MSTYINKYIFHLHTISLVYYVHFNEAAGLSRSCGLEKYITHTQTHVLNHKVLHTHMLIHAHRHAHTLSITSRHLPQYNNQGRKYHQTGQGLETCAGIFPGQTLERVSPDSSSPFSSYASGPRGPPWTEATTAKQMSRG